MNNVLLSIPYAIITITSSVLVLMMHSHNFYRAYTASIHFLSLNHSSVNLVRLLNLNIPFLISKIWTSSTWLKQDTCSILCIIITISLSLLLLPITKYFNNFFFRTVLINKIKMCWVPIYATSSFSYFYHLILAYIWIICVWIHILYKHICVSHILNHIQHIFYPIWSRISMWQCLSFCSQIVHKHVVMDLQLYTASGRQGRGEGLAGRGWKTHQPG